LDATLYFNHHPSRVIRSSLPESAFDPDIGIAIIGDQIKVPVVADKEYIYRVMNGLRTELTHQISCLHLLANL